MGKKIHAYFKSAMGDKVEKAKGEVNALIKKIEKLHRNHILTPPQQVQIKMVRAQNEQALKGAERAYQLTRLEIMSKYIKEEIEIYENKSPNSPQSNEHGAEGGTAGVVAGEA